MVGVVWRAWSLVLVVGSVNAACINFRPDPPPVPPERAGAAPVEQWMVRSGRGISEPLVVAGRSVIVAAANRELAALSLDSGRVQWRERLPGALLGGTAVREAMVLAASARPEGRIDAWSLAGRRIWRVGSGEIATPLLLHDDAVIGVNRRGEMVAFAIGTGRLRWRRPIGTSRVAPHAVGERTMLVTTHDSLFLVETRSGNVLRRAAAPGAVPGGWVRAGAVLVAGLADGGVVAIDPEALGVAWRIPLPDPVTAPLAVRGDTVFAVTRRGLVIEFRAPTGPRYRTVAELDWPVTSGVLVLGDDVVVGGADGRVRGLTRRGQERWRVAVWPPVDVTPVAAGNGFVVAGGDGDIHYFTFE